MHQRTFEWHKDVHKLRIKDVIADNNGNTTDWISTMMLGRDVVVCQSTNDTVNLVSGNNEIVIKVNTPIDKLCIEDAELSEEYGIKIPTKAIRIYGSEKVCSIDIDLKIN
jgi:hypothetical protein